MSSICVCKCVCVLSRFSCFWLCVTLWTAAHQAPLSMGFSRQEFWSGLLFPSPGDLPDLWIEPGSPALSGRFFTVWATREARRHPPPQPHNAITKPFKWRQESQCQREKNKPAFPGFEGGRGYEPRDFGRFQVLEKASINGFSPRALGISLPIFESQLCLWAVWLESCFLTSLCLAFCFVKSK